jgi:hypothetical protein
MRFVVLSVFEKTNLRRGALRVRAPLSRQKTREPMLAFSFWLCFSSTEMSSRLWTTWALCVAGGSQCIAYLQLGSTFPLSAVLKVDFKEAVFVLRLRLFYLLCLGTTNLHSPTTLETRHHKDTIQEALQVHHNSSPINESLSFGNGSRSIH